MRTGDRQIKEKKDSKSKRIFSLSYIKEKWLESIGILLVVIIMMIISFILIIGPDNIKTPESNFLSWIIDTNDMQEITIGHFS